MIISTDTEKYLIKSNTLFFKVDKHNKISLILYMQVIFYYLAPNIMKQGFVPHHTVMFGNIIFKNWAISCLMYQLYFWTFVSFFFYDK